MPEFRYVICDVFTDRPLEGNPLAVFTDARGIPEALLLPLAREMHLSETVFCYPARGTGHVRIRIFTPGHELPFAGHPVLGSAFVLAAPLQLPEIVLETGVGPVPVRIERDGPRVVFGRMIQPVPRVEAVTDPAPLFRALGIERSELPVELYDNGPRHLCVALGDEGKSRPSSRISRRWRACSARDDELLRGRGPHWKTRALPRRRRAGGPGHGLGRRAARLPPGAATAGSPSARRSRSARGRRSVARACSSPAPTAAPAAHRARRGGRLAP